MSYVNVYGTKRHRKFKIIGHRAFFSFLNAHDYFSLIILSVSSRLCAFHPLREYQSSVFVPCHYSYYVHCIYIFYSSLITRHFYSSLLISHSDVAVLR